MEHLNLENFDAFISNSPVLVDFWATWCGPCQMQGRILDAIVAKHPEYAHRIGKVNVDEARELAVRYGISAIPALFFFANGKVLMSLMGAQEESSMLQLLQKYLG